MSITAQLASVLYRHAGALEPGDRGFDQAELPLDPGSGRGAAGAEGSGAGHPLKMRPAPWARDEPQHGDTGQCPQRPAHVYATSGKIPE
jgi:hypothetical protein